MEPPQIVVGSVGGTTIIPSRPTHMMSFLDAIKTCFVEKYVDFSGRASRSEYWWFFLFQMIVALPLFMIDGALFGWGYEDPTWLSTSFSLAIFLPNLGVAIRRLHDTGHSGWYLLIALIPCVGIILLIVWFCSDGEELPNVYGSPPTNQLGNKETSHNYNRQPFT